MLNYDNLVQQMLEAVPEIRPYYEKELEWWDEILPHVVFGDVINPYIISLLKNSQDLDVLQRTFQFFEMMANCPDERVADVLGVTVLERIGDESDVLGKAVKFMGKKTKEISDEIEKGWGRK